MTHRLLSAVSRWSKRNSEHVCLNLVHGAYLGPRTLSALQVELHRLLAPSKTLELVEREGERRCCAAPQGDVSRGGYVENGKNRLALFDAIPF